MSEYHVGCGTFNINAGVVSKDGATWKSKSCVTDEAIDAVRDYMFKEFCMSDDLSKQNSTGGYEWKLKDGRTVELRITVKTER
jgi:hypothetical protein